jgi:hypothetical protein
MLNFADYSAVMVKSLADKHLRANDYSAVMVKYKPHNDLWKFASFFWGGASVRAPREPESRDHSTCEFVNK